MVAPTVKCVPVAGRDGQAAMRSPLWYWPANTNRTVPAVPGIPRSGSGGFGAAVDEALPAAVDPCHRIPRS